MFKGKYKKLIEKLFGTMGDELTDTFSVDWKRRDVGFVGKLDGRVTDLEEHIERLIGIIERRVEEKNVRKKKIS